MDNFYEKDLQFIWKNNFFYIDKLKTTEGKKLYILYNGDYNDNSGPDFLNAHIKIDDVDLYGDIEIHKKASDWTLHRHKIDSAYTNVILHVVYEDDKKFFINDNTKIPTLVIKDFINPLILYNVKYLLANSNDIYCQKFFSVNVNFDELIKQRIKNKTQIIQKLLEENFGSWNETIFQFFAYNFGFKINNNEMLQLAKSIKFNILQKNCNDLDSLLAILYGQANLIEKYKNVKINFLKQRYIFLKNKYSLKKPNINWHFFKLYPPNFPTTRIEQFAYLLHNNEFLLNWILKSKYEDFRAKLKEVKPKLGKDSINGLLINVFIPFNIFYCDKHNIDKNIFFLNLLKKNFPEDNKITRKFYYVPKNAYETQALIELHNNYCMKSRCLHCPVCFKKIQK